jgi:glycine cleavage system regulatory protein
VAVNHILIFQDWNLFSHDDISVIVVTNMFAERHIHLSEFQCPMGRVTEGKGQDFDIYINAEFPQRQVAVLC